MKREINIRFNDGLSDLDEIKISKQFVEDMFGLFAGKTIKFDNVYSGLNKVTISYKEVEKSNGPIKV